ncbi:DUF3558 domain-containing protein [Nocardia mangyaensis]|uniref:DUF3558 domain-containing protein n=1 Tax=Nocardia mangyaensis TaxID=2213200 RepID=UPI0026759615|nr:DUF3558 domain-containing protein [Nocardia mangyaensis]MDO3651248.1 DUF3558 domain-containing protein [Nocardia mangyaensis]
MIRPNVRLVVLGAMAVIAGVSGCTSDEVASPPQTKTPGPVAVTVAPPATRDNPGRASIPYDPCQFFDDADVERAGFTPRTRERADFIADTYSVVGCKFKELRDGRQARILTVDVSNVPLREQPYFDTATEHLTIDGREAVIFHLSEATKSSACFLAMSVPEGSASVQISTSLAFSTEKPCDRIKEVAGVYEAELPD